jgi:hypothetical protein
MNMRMGFTWDLVFALEFFFFFVLLFVPGLTIQRFMILVLLFYFQDCISLPFVSRVCCLNTQCGHGLVT